MWPFKKKPAPSAHPADLRVWNEDWRVGDTAECIVDGVTSTWHPTVRPWERVPFGGRLTVSAFADGQGTDHTLRYFLRFSDWPIALPMAAFRKVRPVSTEQPEVVKRILKAPKPGKDRVREDVE